MTDRDPMPFGKFGKGKSNLTVGQVKRDQPDYVDWLVEQEGFQKKNPELYAFFVDKEGAETPEERRNVDVEGELLAGQPEAFKKFWFKSYGERLRKTGEMNYIGYLRVAITTWAAAQPQQELFKRLPPPLAHIPAPNLSASGTEGNKAEKEGTPVDEDTPF